MTSRDKSYSDNDKQNGKYRKFIEKSTVQFGCVDSSNEPWFLMLTNPIKITEFVLTLLLFGVVVYLITLPDPGLRQTTSIFVIGISIAFLFFDSIQIIAHFAGSDLPEYPMVFINFLGVIFYLAAGCALLYTAPVQTWGRLTSFMLCFMISVVHTIGFLIILLIWRHRFCSMKKCHPLSYGQSGQIFFKNDGGPFFPGNCSCAMENITAEIIEPYESKNYQVFQRPQYTERHHSVPELSLQKQTEIQAEVAHKSRTGSRPDDTTQSVKYSEDLDQTGNQTCDICQRPLPEIARALETTFGQADTSQFPLASSSPKYTHRSSSPRAISTPPHGSHISSPVRQSIQSSLQYTRGHRPGLHTYTTTIPNAIVVKPAPTPPPAPTVAITTTTTSPTPAPTQPTSRAGPCCEFCNCASTICGKVHKLQHNKSQEQVQQSQPSQVNQLHWACFTTAPGTETAIFDATGKQFGCDTGLNPSDKPTMGYNAAYNTRPQMMQAAELSTTVGSIPKSLSDGSSSSFHVQKNKRTQTKSQVYRSVSEGSSDENEKKRYSKSKRKSKNSESTDINKINSIQETFEDNYDTTKPTQEKEEEHEIKIETDKDDKSISNSRKRTKPLYRESSEKNDMTANIDISNNNDDLNTTSRRNSQSNQEDISDESLLRIRNTISPVSTPTSSNQQIKRNEDDIIYDNNNPLSGTQSNRSSLRNRELIANKLFETIEEKIDSLFDDKNS